MDMSQFNGKIRLSNPKERQEDQTFEVRVSVPKRVTNFVKQ